MGVGSRGALGLQILQGSYSCHFFHCHLCFTFFSSLYYGLCEGREDTSPFLAYYSPGKGFFQWVNSLSASLGSRGDGRNGIFVCIGNIIFGAEPAQAAVKRRSAEMGNMPEDYLVGSGVPILVKMKKHVSCVFFCRTFNAFN
ncbi:hypothetical protein F5Y13DRAFT_47077 [Hypoxylon sp. FL1857]|nr:hypothetical protein F5Y13DRAFT_47077 [Hypoxylon sp. FL1857]